MKTKRRINAAYDRRARTPGRRTTTGVLTVAAPCACKGTCGNCATVPMVEEAMEEIASAPKDFIALAKGRSTGVLLVSQGKQTGGFDALESVRNFGPWPVNKIGHLVYPADAVRVHEAGLIKVIGGDKYEITSAGEQAYHAAVKMMGGEIRYGIHIGGREQFQQARDCMPNAEKLIRRTADKLAYGESILDVREWLRTECADDGQAYLIFSAGQLLLKAENDHVEQLKYSRFGGEEERLTTAQRSDLLPSDFALPERRELLISDASHIKPAAARLSMMRHEHHVSPAEYEQARHRIITAGNRFGIHVSEEMTSYMDPSRITLADPNVLSFIRFEVKELVGRGQYPSKEAWAEETLSSGKPVELYIQGDKLMLVDGNHRYYAATVLHRQLPVTIVNSESRISRFRRTYGAAEDQTAGEERGLTWAQRSNGVYWANGLGGTYYLMPQPSGDYQIIWTERNGNQKDLGVHSFASATQVAARFVPHEGRVAIAAEATEGPVCGPWVRMEKDVARFEACQTLSKEIGPVTGHDSLYRYIRPQMEKEDVEVYYAIIVDTQMQVRGFSEIARGARDSVMTPIPDTMRVAIHYAIQYGAMGLCIAHCHPSGIAKPSKADHGVTAAAKSGCEAVGICFLDHLIVGSKSYYSFKAKKSFTATQ